jgi:hypothetical protein
MGGPNQKRRQTPVQRRRHRFFAFPSKGAATSSSGPGERAAASNITPARRYQYVDDLAIVSCFFNSHSYRSKTDVFRRFQLSFEGSNLSVFTAEASLGGEAKVVKRGRQDLLLRGGDIMWQKERILNVLMQEIPRSYTKVAWVDADILFENPNWAVETSIQLDDFAVVQPYSQAFRLGPGEEAYCGQSDRIVPFASVHRAEPALTRSAPYVDHGHTGHAWAARRDVLDALGLYDCAIIGSGDHLMAHAFAGDFSTPCLTNTFGDTDSEHRRHFTRWAERAWQRVEGSIGFVNGTALHLWHGEDTNRGWERRDADLAALDFSPDEHLRLDAAGLWRWSAGAERVAEFSEAYFASRREDDRDRSIPANALMPRGPDADAIRAEQTGI